MYTTPMMLPMDVDGRIYVLQDATGNTIGTGNRAACEMLLKLVMKAARPRDLVPKTSEAENGRTDEN